jgi:hypothetical protein
MSQQGSAPDFSAADSALGYLYQARLALLLALRRLARDETFSVYLETLDDVVFETSGSALELLQLKHHRGRAANLTDASPDLWKSLRVWIEGRESGRIPADAQLVLMTTSPAATGSVAVCLGADGRDEESALRRMEQVTATSVNNTNQPAYRCFCALSADARRTLLASIAILPRSPDIGAVGDELKTEARLSVRREHLAPFLSRLEGWWYGRVVHQLREAAKPPILSSELEAQIDDLREQFQRDALPVDQDILDTEASEEIYRESLFVRQIELAGLGSKRILPAVRDYYRAFTQRSRWLREELLLVGELGSYEKLLREEWEIQFARAVDTVGEDAAEASKAAAAQVIYAWVETSLYPIRPQVRHPSMTRGSFHILADDLRVGWHPEFMDRLAQVLEPGRVR